MKKILFGVFLGIFVIAGIAVLPNSVSAQTFKELPNIRITDQQIEINKNNEGFRDKGTPNGNSDRRTYQTNGAEEGSMTQQDKSYNPNVYGANELKNDSLIQVIRRAINWVLGILSFIALLLCLWGGFQMMTSGGDSKKYEAGINLLKWAAIGLAVIAVSWLVVSLVFYVIEGTAGAEGIPTISS